MMVMLVISMMVDDGINNMKKDNSVDSTKQFTLQTCSRSDINNDHNITYNDNDDISDSIIVMTTTARDNSVDYSNSPGSISHFGTSHFGTARLSHSGISHFGSRR